MRTSIKFDDLDYSNEVLNQSISDILNDNSILHLATVNSEGAPWACTLHFAFDEQMNLYILTYPNSEHMQNVKQNKAVALTIASSQDPAGSNRGMQVTGICKECPEMGLQSCIDIYTSRYPWFKKYITKPQDFERSALDTRFFIIQPKTIKIFDEVIFGEETWVNVDISVK